MLTYRWHNTAQCPFGRDIRMPSFATLRPTSVRRWFWLPMAFALVVAAALFGAAGPARADILPTLTW